MCEKSLLKQEPIEPCKSCPKAGWIDMYGVLVYGCDMGYCICDDDFVIQ
jgi:hypothetical protein